MPEKFQQVQEEYFKLRGQFAIGRIGETEFDAALRKLTIQDAQGRFWMIGANSGDWYHSDGGEWIQADPARTAAPADDISFVEETESSDSSKKLALAFLLIAVVLLGVAAVFFFLFNSDPTLFASANPAATPTRISVLAPTRANLNQTRVSKPTRTPTRRTTAEAAVTPIPVTATAALVIEATDSRPALTTIPTITPNASAPQPSDFPFPDAPSEFPVSENPANASLPPAVYVTNIRVAPNPPPQQQPVTFTASFLNTNPVSIGMEWRIVLLNPAKQGRNNDWGQSNVGGITVPPGRSEFSITHTPITGGGPCITLQVLAARRLQENPRIFLNGTNGNPFAASYTFC